MCSQVHLNLTHSGFRFFFPRKAGAIMDWFEREQAAKAGGRKPFIEKYCPKLIRTNEPWMARMDEYAAIYAARDDGLTIKEIASLGFFSRSVVSKRLKDRERLKSDKAKDAEIKSLRSKAQNIGVFDVWTPRRQWEEMERERGICYERD
jgi:hypothetical protein